MRARIVAPLAAAVVGIVAGAGAALVTTPEDGPKTDPSARDPLGLGIAMVTLDCSPGSGVLVVGFGDASPPLRAAIASNTDTGPDSDTELSYVDTARSCETTFGPEGQAPPRFAVVLGPYPTLAEPCAVRMRPEHRGDFVTALRAGNRTNVKCVCVLPASAGPELRPGMTLTEADAVWVRSLQGMLNDLDGELFPRRWITGEYDDRTADRVAELQAGSAVASERGVVDAATWDLVQARICPGYDF